MVLTSVGHMFCGECLHGALTSNAMGKRACPVCRTNVPNPKRKDGGKSKVGCVYMELKLRSGKKQGKRAVK